MRAIVIDEPDSMSWAEVPDPAPGEGEVIVQVTAAGVNRADVMQRQGHYPPPPGASPYPGLECSGVISAIGARVAEHRVGERVCALLAGGGYAEQVAVPAGQLLPVPQGMSVQESAALPEVACTVWSNVVDIAGLRKGETLLVHGGGGGIGTFADPARQGAGRAAGGHRAGGQTRPAARARRGPRHRLHDRRLRPPDAPAGRADVILDIVGAKYLSRNIAALEPNGRIAIIGMQGGRKGELDLGALMAKRGSVSATTLRARPLGDKARIVAGVRAQVWPLVDAGAIRPIIHTTMPMAEARTRTG